MLPPHPGFASEGTSKGTTRKVMPAASNAVTSEKRRSKLVSETTAEDVRKAQIAEYSKFIATEPIYLDGARAFNQGDAVPVSHVERGIVRDDQVSGVNTKAAKAATGQEK